MKQGTLFAGFTRPSADATTDGVSILTRERERMASFRTIKLTEKNVTEQIRHFLDRRGWSPVRTPVGRLTREYGGEFLGPTGRPDWLFLNSSFKPGFMWVEMKATGEKPEPAQIDVMKLYSGHGWLVCWTDSPDKFATWYERQLELGLATGGSEGLLPIGDRARARGGIVLESSLMACA